MFAGYLKCVLIQMASYYHRSCIVGGQI